MDSTVPGLHGGLLILGGRPPGIRQLVPEDVDLSPEALPVFLQTRDLLLQVVLRGPLALQIKVQVSVLLLEPLHVLLQL